MKKTIQLAGITISGSGDLPHLSLGDDGIPVCNLEQIKMVGVENIVDVETHTIHRVAGSTSHYIRFIGGGEVRLAYNQAGKLLELSVEKVKASITADGCVMFRHINA